MNPFGELLDHFQKIRFEPSRADAAQIETFANSATIAQERIEKEEFIALLIKKRLTIEEIFNALETCVLAFKVKERWLEHDLLKSYIEMIRKYSGSQYGKVIEKSKEFESLSEKEFIKKITE